MAESDKLTDKAADLAAQAAAAAAPLVDKAAELAAQARELAADGVSTVAEGLDKLTGGRLAGPISSVSVKIEDQLDVKPAEKPEKS